MPPIRIATLAGKSATVSRATSEMPAPCVRCERTVGCRFRACSRSGDSSKGVPELGAPPKGQLGGAAAAESGPKDGGVPHECECGEATLCSEGEATVWSVLEERKAHADVCCRGDGGLLQPKSSRPCGSAGRSLTEVPSPRATITADFSPSRSIICKYASTAFPPASSTLRPICRRSLPESSYKRSCRCSFEMRAVRKESYNEYSGSFTTMSSSTSPMTLATR
mmetsp:Transcript_41656/g.97489  ORF Transcript_41656/g.97489 Transcript_41656/m.97489 type:complete len:223 (-) Transcript_41656:566-1234(-)